MSGNSASIARGLTASGGAAPRPDMRADMREDDPRAAAEKRAAKLEKELKSLSAKHADADGVLGKLKAALGVTPETPADPLAEINALRSQAAKAADSKGRLRPETEDDVRPAFQRDRDRIIHCKAFRRLKHKTQVFFAPTGDHYQIGRAHV